MCLDQVRAENITLDICVPKTNKLIFSPLLKAVFVGFSITDYPKSSDILDPEILRKWMKPLLLLSGKYYLHPSGSNRNSIETQTMENDGFLGQKLVLLTLLYR